MPENRSENDHWSCETARPFEYVELGGQVQASQTLAEEVALAVSYNGISQAVMMVSPDALEDFVVGFSLTGALVTSPEDIYDIRLSGQGEQRRADLEVSSRAFWAIKQQRRHLAGTSGCGLCGVEALDQALPTLASLDHAALPDSSLLEGMRDRISAAQLLARQSGALHAAVFVDRTSGDILLCREDIGRHNALDKLIGAVYRSALGPSDGFAVVTSRCSLELIHKAVRGRISTLVCLSAPTALSVQWARTHGLNLVHIPHRSGPRVYSPAPVL
ncbi:formate dehydrogenase accessory sulfurtransferase FdhD [Pseudomonas sp. OIL-1]|uniref:formate dehydrogenase accessory sulfurtransferase FdhD n=1 Tax=Pseudomonas sp. OIL-1 TaxID=2706126 RepID=UPI0013A761FB|nr:formate dehydrogenase accessory sulfurtransferase FdhD [Pseudomonas sp. OIL-1]QIB50810.1 formate dehydrogenase accessory sulfurtransferase FdhD [Pseudomonas sp. OIL-1]